MKFSGYEERVIAISLSKFHSSSFPRVETAASRINDVIWFNKRILNGGHAAICKIIIISKIRSTTPTFYFMISSTRVSAVDLERLTIFIIKLLTPIANLQYYIIAPQNCILV